MPQQQIVVDLGQLDVLISAMNAVGDQATQLDSYARGQVCSTAGLDGSALAPIGAALDTVADAFTTATTGFAKKWSRVADAAVATAHHHVAQDEAVADALGSYRGPWSGPRCYASTGADHASYRIEDLDLPAGEEGGETLDHDPLFEAAAATWDTMREHIDKVLGWARSLGVDLGTLPDTDLRGAIVVPLSGDYRKIRANADACTTLDAAMGQWGGNFNQLAAHSYAALEGRAGTGLRAHLVAYGQAVARCGDVVGQASHVFEGVATTSERIAVRVEQVMASLAKKLASLASRIAKRVNPVVSAFVLAKDVVGKGPADAVKELWDIVTDVKDVADTIHDCLDMVDTVREWAQTQADRIKELDKVVDTLAALPGIGDAPGVASVKRHVGDIASKLEDVDLGGDTSAEAGALARRLAGLEATGSGDSGDSAPPPEGPVGMADPQASLRDPATGDLVA